MAQILGYIFIFCAKLVEVTLFTFRTLMIIKGKKVPAALIGFIEVIVWISALGVVMSSLGDKISILIYAAGFAAGNYLGTILEEKVAVGIISAKVIIDEKDTFLIDVIRSEGFGVTVVEGKGMGSKKAILHIILKRKELNKLNVLINTNIQSPVISITDTRAFYGGFLNQIKK